MEQDNKFTYQSHRDDCWTHYRYDRTPTKVAFQQFTKRLTEGKSLIETGGLPDIFASYLSYLIKIWPFKGKFFSPFIAIYARK